MNHKNEGYKNLIVWQKSMDLVVVIYRLSESFPKSELYSLISQIRRCSISIPSNIAEGSRRGSKKEWRQFLRIAYGSGSELETQVLLAKRLKFGKQNDYTLVESLLTEVMKMLNKMVNN